MNSKYNPLIYFWVMLIQASIVIVIPNETVGFDVNRIFHELRMDGDPYTDYSESTDLPTRHPGGDHFNSEAYRIIGNRVQRVYFDMRSANSSQ